MSFATPGMTDVYVPRATVTPSAPSDTPFFSNVGEISFKPSVRIYSGTDADIPMYTAAAPTLDTSTASTTSTRSTRTSVPDGVLETSYQVVGHKDTHLNADISVDENARRLAAMCVQSRAPSEGRARHAARYASRLGSVSEHAYQPEDLDTAANGFDYLVQEFIHAGEPEFEEWMELNPRRKLQPYAEAREMYNVIQTNGYKDRVKRVWYKTTGQDEKLKHYKRDYARSQIVKDAAKKYNQEQIRIRKQKRQEASDRADEEQMAEENEKLENAARGYHGESTYKPVKNHDETKPLAVENGDDETKPLAVENGDHRPGKGLQLLEDPPSADDRAIKVSPYELHEPCLLDLHAHTQEMSAALLHNNDQLSRKFGAIDAQLRESEKMGEAMHTNNALIKREFEKINTKLDVQDQGLRTHHKALAAMRSDLNAQRPSAALTAGGVSPAAPVSRLDINQLNRMARNF